MASSRANRQGGSNVNIYPEVAAPVAKVLVHEGERVAAGAALLTLDDSVQKASTEQLRLQADAALALLNELKAQPRKETLGDREVAGRPRRLKPQGGARPVRQAQIQLRHRFQVDQQGCPGHRRRCGVRRRPRRWTSRAASMF